MPNPDACLVTGYVRLDNENRNHERYADLGGRLLAAAGPTVAYLDREMPARSRAGQVILPASLDACWYWRASDGAALPGGNPKKDTRSFLSVQHQKTAWVADAVRWTDAEVLVWADFGLLHVDGITPELVRAFLERAADAPRDRISMASIWGPPSHRVAPFRVAWHCAGGVFVVPRRLANFFDVAVQWEAQKVLSAGFATWEVNTWADVWRRIPDKFRYWMCDHNATLLEAGP